MKKNNSLPSKLLLSTFVLSSVILFTSESFADSEQTPTVPSREESSDLNHYDTNGSTHSGHYEVTQNSIHNEDSLPLPPSKSSTWKPMSDLEFNTGWNLATEKGDISNFDGLWDSKWFFDEDNVLQIGRSSEFGFYGSASVRSPMSIAMKKAKAISFNFPSPVSAGSDRFSEVNLETINGFHLLDWSKHVVAFSFIFNNSTMPNIDFSSVDGSNFRSMSRGFNFSTWDTLDLSGLHTPIVTNLDYVFNSVVANKLNVSGWDVSSATRIDNMFRWSRINEIQGIDTFRFPNVTNASSAFSSRGFKHIDFKKMELKPSTNISGIVNGATDLESIVTGDFNGQEMNLDNMKRLREFTAGHIVLGQDGLKGSGVGVIGHESGIWHHENYPNETFTSDEMANYDFKANNRTGRWVLKEKPKVPVVEVSDSETNLVVGSSGEVAQSLRITFPTKGKWEILASSKSNYNGITIDILNEMSQKFALTSTPKVVHIKGVNSDWQNSSTNFTLNVDLHKNSSPGVYKYNIDWVIRPAVQ